MSEPVKYPDCYLHVLEHTSGEEWIFPLRGNASLDIKHQIKRWIKHEYGGELRLQHPIVTKMASVCGTHYARIMTDGRPPDSVVCWTSAGFFMEPTY